MSVGVWDLSGHSAPVNIDLEFGGEADHASVRLCFTLFVSLHWYVGLIIAGDVAGDVGGLCLVDICVRTDHGHLTVWMTGDDTGVSKVSCVRRGKRRKCLTAIEGNQVLNNSCWALYTSDADLTAWTSRQILPFITIKSIHIEGRGSLLTRSKHPAEYKAMPRRW